MGGVLPDGTMWSGSSKGPTADGRIKPDLLAQAQGVYTINPQTADGYKYVNGNSYSAPLGAGVGAIMLSAQPALTPMILRDILVQNASHFNDPDNIHGYGLIDLESIILNVFMKTGVSVRDFQVQPQSGRNIISWIADREIDNENWLIQRKNQSENYTTIANLYGRSAGLNSKLYSYTDFDVNGTETFTYEIVAELSSGERVIIDSVRVESYNTTGITLLNNSPNPFNNETRITFGLNKTQKISLKIFNLNGQLVRTLIEDQSYEGQYHHVLWNATDDHGQSLASGTYYLYLKTEEENSVVKLLYIK
jgi:hypothetical protein